MRWVVIRDDDTNALTPVEWLDRLYRPFLDRGLPVNLATIPVVRTDVTYGDNVLEGFLVARNGVKNKLVPLSQNPALVGYLQANPLYHIVQHGCHHEFVHRLCEFDHDDREDIVRRLEEGSCELIKAGFSKPETFVAPYDRLTRTSWEEVSKRFRVISTGWFELDRLPKAWWPRYVLKKVRQTPHWQVGNNILLSHPGCFLSYHRPYASILDEIKQAIQKQPLTVLVTHWWEFFRDGRPDDPFIQVLHDTAEYLAGQPDIQVVTFRDVAQGKVPLH